MRVSSPFQHLGERAWRLTTLHLHGLRVVRRHLYLPFVVRWWPHLPGWQLQGWPRPVQPAVRRNLCWDPFFGASPLLRGRCKSICGNNMNSFHARVNLVRSSAGPSNATRRAVVFPPRKNTGTVFINTAGHSKTSLALSNRLARELGCLFVGSLHHMRRRIIVPAVGHDAVSLKKSVN